MSGREQRMRSLLWLYFIRESKANTPLLLLSSLSSKFIRRMKKTYFGAGLVTAGLLSLALLSGQSGPGHMLFLGTRQRGVCGAAAESAVEPLREAAATCRSGQRRHTEIGTAPVTTKHGWPLSSSPFLQSREAPVRKRKRNNRQDMSRVPLGIASLTTPLSAPQLTSPNDCSKKSLLKLSYIWKTPRHWEKMLYTVIHVLHVSAL